MKRYMVLEEGYQYDTPTTKKLAMKIAKNLRENIYAGEVAEIEVVKLKLVKTF